MARLDNAGDAELTSTKELYMYLVSATAATAVKTDKRMTETRKKETRRSARRESRSQREEIPDIKAAAPRLSAIPIAFKVDDRRR